MVPKANRWCGEVMNAYQRLVQDLTDLWDLHPGDFDHFIHKAIETAKKHEPHKFARRAVQAVLRRLGTTQEQWEQAADILFKKEEHEAIKILKSGYGKVLSALKSAEEKLERTKRIGAGRTVAPDLLVGEVVPAIEELGEECMTIARQMRERFE